MSVFDVRVSANADYSDAPGYQQSISAYLDGKEMAIHSCEPHAGICERPEWRTILSRSTEAGGPTAAIRKFREWQHMGHAESWLTEAGDANEQT